MFPPDGGMLAVLKTMMNFSLLADPLFLLIGISNSIAMIGFYTPFVYLPNMANMSGISVADASFLVSVIGVSNTLGRVLAGWVSDFSWVNIILIYCKMYFLPQGELLDDDQLCNHSLSPHRGRLPSLLLVLELLRLRPGFWVLRGLAQAPPPPATPPSTAAYISLTSIVLVDLVGLDKLTSAFGLLTLFRGFSSVIGPPINGKDELVD